jgi:hypothetical protein
MTARPLPYAAAGAIANVRADPSHSDDAASDTVFVVASSRITGV